MTQRSDELHRLIEAFEKEAAQFHDLQFHVFHITRDCPPPDRPFSTQNHAIVLWQYYGRLQTDAEVDRFVQNVDDSDLKWGLRGASHTLIGVIEGDTCPLFLRMAKRAASLLSDDETEHFKSRVVREIMDEETAKQGDGKPAAAVNDNPLAVWLNYLLYHLSLTNPSREFASRIEPDPFSLSLLALERLASDHAIGKADRSQCKLADIKFKVAMSFPGEKRRYVSRVVNALREPLGKDSVFYDYDYQAQLARPNLDTLLQRIYREQSDLIVVFLCAEYAQKQWCGLEWRTVRDIIKAKQDKRVMFVRFDDADVEGVLSIDGYVNAKEHNAKQVAQFVLERINGLE